MSETRRGLQSAIEVPCSEQLKLCVCHALAFGRRLKLIQDSDDEDSDSSTRNCPRHQVWCKIPRRNLQFIDQSVEISRSYIDGADTEYRGLSSDSELNLEQVEAHVGHGKPRHGEIRAEIRVDQGPLDQISPEVAFDASVGALLQGASTLESLGDLAHAGPLEGSVFAISPSDHYHFSSVPSYGPVPTTQRHTYVKECSAPIKDPAKAELMRCFIHQVGSILDPHDDMRGLVSNLIERAMLDPELEAAILSLSGKFLRAGGSWGAMVTSFEHHETSRNGSLTHSSGILGDSVNKAVHSILHQISVLLDETDRFETDGDSIGTSLVDEVFLPLQNPHNFTPSSDSNEGKLLWTSVWLDLYRSITRETTVQSTLHRSTLGEMSLGTDDRTWTNRILLNLVDAVDYSFGTTQSSATYNRLISYSTTWMESKPDSFTPILIQESSKGLTFPEILLISDIAIAGLQYYHLVRILLIANNPLVPRFGSSRKPAIEKQDVSPNHSSSRYY